MREHGPWKIRGTREVYRDPWVEVERDDVIRPDGADGTHVVVRIKAGISVLPLDNDGCVYLTDEFHYALGGNSLEVISGGMEPGEDPLETARRELEEEVGIRAARWQPLGRIDPMTSVLLSPSWLFLARELTFVEAAPEGTERIRRVRCTLDEAYAAAMDGRITHASSVILVLKAWQLVRDGG